MDNRNFADVIKDPAHQNALSIKINSFVKGKINGETEYQGKEYYTLDCGLKYVAILPKQEITEEVDKEKELNLVVKNYNDHYVIMKLKRNNHNKNFKRFNISNIVTAKIKKKVDNGYEVNVDGRHGFLKSKEDFEIDSEISCYVYKIINQKLFLTKSYIQTVTVKILEKVENGFKASFENKEVFVKSDKEFEINSEISCYKNSKNEFWTQKTQKINLKVGDVVKGKVISFNDFFTFVNIEGVNGEGLVHLQELSWNPVRFPGEVVSQEMELNLKVIGLNDNCVYLSLKAMTDNPWTNHQENFKEGEVYEGTIKNINPYELEVDLGNNIIGVVNVSQISWGFQKGSDLPKKFQIHQKIKAKLISKNHKFKKMILSIRDTLEDPFIKFQKEHKIGDIIEGKILNDPNDYKSFLFVEIIEGIDGILHQSEMNWSMGKSIADFRRLEKNNSIKVKIIGIDEQKKNVSVSVKRIFEDVFADIKDKLNIGEYYDLEVKKTGREGIFCEAITLNNFRCSLKRADIFGYNSNEKINYTQGQIIKAKLIKVLENSRIIIFSVFAYNQDMNTKAIQDNKNETAASSFGNFLK